MPAEHDKLPVVGPILCLLMARDSRGLWSAVHDGLLKLIGSYRLRPHTRTLMIRRYKLTVPVHRQPSRCFRCRRLWLLMRCAAAA